MFRVHPKPPCALLASLDHLEGARGGRCAVASVDGCGNPHLVFTWSTLAARVRERAATLVQCVPPGGIALVIGAPGTELPSWYLAALRARVGVLPLPAGAPEPEVRRIAARSMCAAVVRGSTVERVDGPGCPPMAVPGAVVLVSSGTTGASKLAVRGAAALNADAENVAHATRLGPRGRLLLAVPGCHSYALDMIVACILTGAAIDVLEPFDPASAAGHLAHHATVFPGVPAMFEALARAAPPTRPEPEPLIFSAGSELVPRVREAFEAAWRLPVGELYGASELGSVTFNDPWAKGFEHGHVGRPLPGVSVRVLAPDDTRQEVAAGSEGHVAVRAPSMFSGYLDGEPPLADGHFLTGDLGRIDTRGRLFITGRLKLLIDVGGLKVNPQEVEAALAQHPAVAECVVVPLPVSDTVTRLRAVYVPRGPGPSPESLRMFLRERLAPHQLPRVIEPVACLPRSPTGKVLRAVVATC